MDIQVSSNFERLLFEMNGRDGGLTAEQLQRFRASGPPGGRGRPARRVRSTACSGPPSSTTTTTLDDDPRDLRGDRDAARPALGGGASAPPRGSARPARSSRWPRPTRPSSPTPSSGPPACARRCRATSPTCSTARSASPSLPNDLAAIERFVESARVTPSGAISETVQERRAARRRRGRVLQHPPVAEAAQDGDVGAEALGRTAGELLAAGVVVLGGDDHQARPALGGRQLARPTRSSSAGPPSGTGRGCNDPCPHRTPRRTPSRRPRSCRRRRTSRPGRPPARRPSPATGLLAGAGRLPHLGHVVPHVLGVGAAGDVGAPRADQIGTGGGEALDVAAAPVVADQVDRAVERRRARPTSQAR